MTLLPHLRNPWKGISVWKEFWYDVRHPILLHKRVWEGAMGRNPEVTSLERVVGIMMILVGCLMMLLGATVLFLNYFT